jgi:hypothetical protein
MPRKPSNAFGHIAFSKAGTVQKEMTQLSLVKEAQELEAVSKFAALFNEVAEGGRVLTDLRQLSENDHDFSALISGTPLQIQLTELVDRSYTFDMTAEEYNSGTWSEAIQGQYGARPRRVEIALRGQALTALIEKKVAKSYAKPASGQLWLVVFTTTNYLTEYIEGGSLRLSAALRLARAHLRDASSGPFNEVWFTNMQTRPVRIWPA